MPYEAPLSISATRDSIGRIEIDAEIWGPAGRLDLHHSRRSSFRSVAAFQEVLRLTIGERANERAGEKSLKRLAMPKVG